MNFRNILFAVCALALIWTGVAAVMHVTEKHTSTPEKVVGLMAQAPWLDGKDVSAGERGKYLENIIANVNRLDFDQRRSMREDGRDASQQFFDSLSKDERARFLKETVENHFKSMMQAFNKMTQEERQKIVKNAMNDMKRNDREGRNMDKLRQDDEQLYETVVDKGLGAYYEGASAETKMDLAPLMEQMQQRMRGFPAH